MGSPKATHRLTTIDLFAGCGGLSYGFQQAADQTNIDLAVAQAVEMDIAAAATYAANFGDHVYAGKIEDWLAEGSIPEADIIVGGPPCQGFSALGKRDPKDPRNKLWRQYVKTVAQVQPKFFVMENVPQFSDSPEFKKLQREVRSGELTNYEIQVLVLSAHQHGVAQKRKRAMVVGRLKNYGPVELEAAQDTVTLRDALKVLPVRVPRSKRLPARPAVFRHKKLNGPYTTWEIHVRGPMSERMEQMVRSIPPGGNRFDLSEELQYDCWLAGTYGGNDVMGRLEWDAPSVTIRTQFFKPDKGRYIHPTADRAITYAEAALIQGFPADYKWCGSLNQIARQIGNAVPVPLASTVARMVFGSYLKGPVHGS